MKIQEDSFFKPVLSTLGLIVSFIAAVTPLFPTTSLRSMFLDNNLAGPASLVSFAFGLITTWTVITFYQYIQINLGTKEVGGNILPKVTIGPAQIIWISLMVDLILFTLFFTIVIPVLQAAIYILFFTLLIFVFALLVSITKARYEYLAVKDLQAEIIFRTLEKNRLISPGISIYSNELTTQREQSDLDIRHFGLSRKVKLETVIQKKEIIEVILSEDCRELIKVLKKQETG